MSSQEINIDIESILGDDPPAKIDIDKLVIGEGQARQSKTRVKEDDDIVESIRRTRGVLHPIIVKQINDQYDVILGQRRLGAYKILVKEDKDRYSKIKAFVIKKSLTADQKKIISFVENFGRDAMGQQDYINAIEFFYTKYNGNITSAAKALGISRYFAEKYLDLTRLSDRVKLAINKKEFSLSMAKKALEALGEDTDSVDDDMLIKTATVLKKLQPARRDLVINKMKKQPLSNKNVEQARKEVPQKLQTVEITINEDQSGRIREFQIKYDCANIAEAAVEALNIGLEHGLQNN